MAFNFFQKKKTETEVEDQAPETDAQEPEDSGEEAPAVDEADEVESEASKPGFLKGAWEATKKLALTPVDPYFERMAAGLNRTRKNLVGQLRALVTGRKIDEDFWEELEDILITSDMGADASEYITERLQEIVKEEKIKESEELLGRTREIIAEILGDDPAGRELNVEPGRTNVILMIGVNGAGKTTSTAKLAHLFKESGLSVMMAAADTFRAAAIEQLEVWSKRIDVPLIKAKEGADPAAVVFDAASAAKARDVDVLIVDTAGRLHSKSNLMKELEKMGRVLERELGQPAHEVLLVLDATTGQNALHQAREFARACPVTGLILCKLDGTAKGGIMVAVAREHSIPVKFVGVGEAVDDLRPFQPKAFLNALFGEVAETQEAS